jgi:regulator of protease activity HflC (stomatin/prohibitin superfamily)
MFGIIFLSMWGIPKYRIYAQTMRGTAAFKEAEIDRQILVEEARAQEEALAMRAQGEAARERIKADATSYAIEKLGATLESHPSYLRWMWINEVAGGEGDRIYIPTEAGMPILEAGAFKGK